MFTATEQELIDYARNGAVYAFKIVETNDGKFNLTFTLTWKKDGDCILTSARKDLRKWAKVNTLIDYIKTLNLRDTPISIQPYYDERFKSD